MKYRALPFVCILLLMAATGWSSVSHLALDESGSLNRLDVVDNELVLTLGANSEEPLQVVVPGTTDAILDHTTLAIDRRSGTLVLLWHELVDGYLPQIMLATYQDQVWFGPTAIAGLGEASDVSSPEMMVHQARNIDEDGTEVVTSFIYASWWADQYEEDGGYAVSASLPLDGSIPQLKAMQTQEFRGILPYGIACGLVKNQSSLKQPKLFFDPETGDPHIAFVILKECLFSIMQIDTVWSEEPDSTKRRRQISVWRSRREISVHPKLTLSDASFKVGHNLSIVMYWDREDSIDYATLREDTFSEIRTLTLDDEINHTRAIELIGSLAN